MAWVVLQEAYDISRDEQGRIYAWRGRKIAEFNTPLQAKEYIITNWPTLKDKELRFLTGGATLLGQLNAFLDAQRKT